MIIPKELFPKFSIIFQRIYEELGGHKANIDEVITLAQQEFFRLYGDKEDEDS